MPTSTKSRSVKKPTLRMLSTEVARLRTRVEDLEDLCDLNAAVTRNQGKPGVAWDKAEVVLGAG